MPSSSRDIQDFLDMKYRILSGKAVSKIHDCFGFCNVMTAFDRSKGYFMRISTVVSVLHRRQLNEKYDIYRQTIKSSHCT
jgi:hypothetical protein